ncbi:MAG: Rid family detoxifying hydrolase [Methanomassiliicoccales archaeon]|nr:Rid family detoxifying hydrolase [Methanomassiliicoccales archaeon]
MKEIINTHRAPKPIGPYSQAVVAGGFVFCSGQIGIDPETNQLVKSSIADETRQVLMNLKAIVEAAGSSLENAVRATVYLTSLEYFKEMNEVYREFFPTAPPSRATVEVSNLAMGARVEIDLIAAVK